MRKLSTIYSLFLVVVLFIVISCKESKSIKANAIWSNTTWRFLDDESIKIRLPNQLKKTSRFRIQEDLPALSKDSSKLLLLQNSLKELEFKDSDLDVYIDTTAQYRLIILCNTARIDFDKRDASIIKKQMEESNRKAEMQDSALRFGELDAKLSATSELKMTRYTTPVTNMLNGTLTYNTICYLSGDSFTLIIYEFSDTPPIIEDYLWSTKVE